MHAAAIDFTYMYDRASGIEEQARGNGLYLATCSATQEHPHFFEGRIRQPRLVGVLLVSLTDIVRTHYFLPRPALLDPVVTSNEAMVRMEGFSGCCGVYARVDLDDESFDADFMGRGTTNVDFNAPMRAALMQLSDHEQVRLSVGPDEVALERAGGAVVEKKVKLPLRWLKGFSEVQAYQPRLEPAMELSGADARRLVRSLPLSNPPKRPSYVVPAGRGARLSQRPGRGAVPVLGLHRLAVLPALCQRAKSLRIWTDRDAGTSAWEVQLPGARFVLMLSPEVYRGFSGEGQVLKTLAVGDWESALKRVKAQLTWQNQIDAGQVAAATGLEADRVAAALAAVGARGLVGYDVSSGRYFHREMPFDVDLVEALQPRLAGARKLIEKDGVLESRSVGSDAWDVQVQGTGVVHRVRLRTGGDRCTCPWFAKYEGRRGPCKHVLAARMTVDGDDA